MLNKTKLSFFMSTRSLSEKPAILVSKSKSKLEFKMLSRSSCLFLVLH